MQRLSSGIRSLLVAAFLVLLFVPGLASVCNPAAPVAFLTRIVASTGGMCRFYDYHCGGTTTERVAVHATAAGSMCRAVGLFRAPVDFRDLVSCSSMPAAFGMCAPSTAFAGLAMAVAAAVLVPVLARTARVRAGPAPFVSSRRVHLAYLMPRGEPVA